MSELSDAQCDLLRAAIRELDDACLALREDYRRVVHAADAASDALDRPEMVPDSPESDENGGNATPPPNAETNPPAAIVNQNGGQCAHILTAYTHVAPDGFTHEDCIDCGALLRLTGRPPARGTHSSDYPSGRRCPCADATTQTARNGPVPGQTYEAHLAEYEAAARWSRGL
jgi:hypothetical protein